MTSATRRGWGGLAIADMLTMSAKTVTFIRKLYIRGGWGVGRPRLTYVTSYVNGWLTSYVNGP